MPKKKLTDITIRNLQPPKEGQETTWDTQVTGFGVRCSHGGTKSFIVYYGNPKRKRITIGRYPTIPLGEARKKAQQILLEATLNPAKIQSPTYTNAVKRFLKLREPELKSRTYAGYKRLLKNRFKFDDTIIEDISTHEIVDALDEIKYYSTRASSYRVLKVFFNWCVEREYCSTNPMATIRPIKPISARERVLEDEEIAAIWFCTKQIYHRYNTIVRLLLVTGQRKNQIANLHVDWVSRQSRMITFPANIMKNNKQHEIPLSPLTDFLLWNECPRPQNGYYFSPEGFTNGRPFSAWSKSKKKLDKELKKILPNMKPWCLHDLRRTWSTNSAFLEIPQNITDRILSHATGSTVSRIYNRHHYRQEMKHAMKQMDLHILKIVKQTNLLRIKR